MKKYSVFLMALFLFGCAIGLKEVRKTMSPEQRLQDLERRYNAILESMGDQYGAGGKIVLEVAYKGLAWGYAQDKWDLVGIEDLWAEALKEGGGLFNRPPEKRWGSTSAEETLDMIGQTTIGPWQITTTNVQNIFGIPYGIKKEWTVKEIVQYCRENPEIQAKMISDYIQNAYSNLGRRAPYAIQSYFWLEAYAKGEIGQGYWLDLCLVKLQPGQTWKDITPEQKRNTGFYAKQLVLGNKRCQHGLFYWLYVTKSFDEIKEVLRTWRDQVKCVWDAQNSKAVPTTENGGHRIKEEDIILCECHPEFRTAIKKLVAEVNEEK